MSSEDQPPEGYEWQWVPEETLAGSLDWDTVLESEAQQCRRIQDGKRCAAKSVARLNRSRTPGKEQWWHYCERHLFGRRIGPSGDIEVRVAREVSQ